MRAFELLQETAQEYSVFAAELQRRSGERDDAQVYVGRLSDGTIGLVAGGIWVRMQGADAQAMARYILSLLPPPGQPFDPPLIGKEPGSSATGSVRHT